MFSVHTTPEEFENATITGYFGFVFEETREGKSRDYREVIVSGKLRFQNVFLPTRKRKADIFKFLHFEERYRKAPFSKCFPSTRKRKAGVSRFLRCEERFRKASFSLRVSVNGRPQP